MVFYVEISHKEGQYLKEWTNQCSFEKLWNNTWNISDIIWPGSRFAKLFICDRKKHVWPEFPKVAKQITYKSLLCIFWLLVTRSWKELYLSAERHHANISSKPQCNKCLVVLFFLKDVAWDIFKRKQNVLRSTNSVILGPCEKSHHITKLNNISNYIIAQCPTLIKHYSFTHPISNLRSQETRGTKYYHKRVQVPAATSGFHQITVPLDIPPAWARAARTSIFFLFYIQLSI